MTLMMSGDKGISAFPNGDDFFSWLGTINGPQGTVSYLFFICFNGIIIDFLSIFYLGL